jgi:hypothetical protein
MSTRALLLAAACGLSALPSCHPDLVAGPAPATAAVTSSDVTAANAAIVSLHGIKRRRTAAENAPASASMDAAWKALEAAGPDGEVQLADAVDRELTLAAPDSFFLVDAASYLYRHDAAGQAARVLLALGRASFADDAVQGNSQELFELLHLLADDHRAGVLGVLERAALEGDLSVAFPRHAMWDVDPTLAGAFLYGPLGTTGEAALDTLLGSDHRAGQRILEILNWVGSRRSTSAVLDYLERHPDDDTFERAVGFVMRVGGREARDEIARRPMQALSPKSKARLVDVLTEIRATSRRTVIDALEKQFGRGSPLTPTIARARLRAMIASSGHDDDLNPANVLEAGLPPDELESTMIDVRSAMFQRLSPEALDDVKVANMLISAASLR